MHQAYHYTSYIEYHDKYKNPMNIYMYLHHLEIQLFSFYHQFDRCMIFIFNCCDRTYHWNNIDKNFNKKDGKSWHSNASLLLQSRLHMHPWAGIFHARCILAPHLICMIGSLYIQIFRSLPAGENTAKIRVDLSALHKDSSAILLFPSFLMLLSWISFA